MVQGKDQGGLDLDLGPWALGPLQDLNAWREMWTKAEEPEVWWLGVPRTDCPTSHGQNLAVDDATFGWIHPVIWKRILRTWFKSLDLIERHQQSLISTFSGLRPERCSTEYFRLSNHLYPALLFVVVWTEVSDSFHRLALGKTNTVRFNE